MTLRIELIATTYDKMKICIRDLDSNFNLQNRSFCLVKVENELKQRDARIEKPIGNNGFNFLWMPFKLPVPERSGFGFQSAALIPLTNCNVHGFVRNFGS